MLLNINKHIFLLLEFDPGGNHIHHVLIWNTHPFTKNGVSKFQSIKSDKKKLPSQGEAIGRTQVSMHWVNIRPDINSH